MKDIRTKDAAKKDIKVLDKTDNLAKAVRDVSVRTKDQIKNLSDDGQETPEEYANDKIKYMTEDVVKDSGRLAGKGAKKTYEGGKKLYKDMRRKRQEQQTTEEPIKQTAKSTGKQTAKQIERSIKTQQRNIKTAERNARQAVKTSKETVKAAVKTAEQTAKASKKASDAAAKTAQKTAQAAKETAVAAYRTAAVAVKASITAVKAMIAGIEKTGAAIAAGGWVAVAVILVICIVGLIAGSCFGIFFSSDDSGTGMTLQTAVIEIENEYQQKITDIQNGTPHDVFEMSGSCAAWTDVLAVYAVKIAADPEDPQEVASMDARKMQLLKGIFWKMNSVFPSARIKTEDVIVEIDDGNGNITERVEQKTRTYLHITVSHKNADEMAVEYNFNTSQRKQLAEMLSEDKQKTWGQVLNELPDVNANFMDFAE